MALADLDEAALATLTTRVKQRIMGETTGMSAPPDATVTEIASASVVFILEVAPQSPESIGREAAIRLGGWLLDNRPAVVSHEITDPSGTAYKLQFANMAATANGFRHSGASALVARFIVRRAGIIG